MRDSEAAPPPRRRPRRTWNAPGCGSSSATFASDTVRSISCAATANVLVFVEVKCRQARWGDDPAAAVSGLKQWRLTRLARHYLKWRRLGEPACRFDVVAVIADGGDVRSVRHVRGAFDAVG